MRRGIACRALQLGVYISAPKTPDLTAFATILPRFDVFKSPNNAWLTYPRGKYEINLASFSSSSSSFESDKQNLLDLALRHVVKFGWRQQALEQAALDMGKSPGFVATAKAGSASLVVHHIAACNAKLEHDLALQPAHVQSMLVKERLAQSIRQRLEMNIPYIEIWPEALSLMASHPQTALNLIGKLTDILWRSVGDTSLNIHWYAKRAALAGVYMSTEMFMLTDCSPNFENTWAALDRRLDEALALGSAADSITDLTQGLDVLISSFIQGNRHTTTYDESIKDKRDV